MDECTRQSVLDEEHLRLLRIGYFIQGEMTVLMALVSLIYMFMGIFVASLATTNSVDAAPPPRFVGDMLALFGALFFVSSGLFAAL